MTGERWTASAATVAANATQPQLPLSKLSAKERSARQRPVRTGRWAWHVGASAVAGILVILAASAARANGDDGDCDVGPDGVVTCTGDQSGGVSFPSGSGITTLNVNSSTEIRPQAGKQGIFLETSGTAPAPVPDHVLGIPIPGDGSGGDVVVDSLSDITTAGDNAHGIEVQSSTTGFPSSVTADLDNFINNNGEANIEFSVASVANQSGNVGQPVAGVLIGDDGLPVKDAGGNEVDGGIFTINADGTFAFDFGTAFGDLAVGELRTTRVNFDVEMSKVGTTDPPITSEGFLDVIVTREVVLDADGNPVLDGDGNPVTQLVIHRPVDEASGQPGPQRIEAQYLDFGGSAKPIDEGTVFPDLTGYAERLRADAQEGGAGNSVNVISQGTIETSGVEAHGILAESRGARGGDGRDASGLFTCRSSHRGGTGKRGGNVTVTANGSITTTGKESAGITAVSQAGNGGRGGKGSECRYGATGGTGGNGGNIEIHGSARIETNGDFASGILALSQGGGGGKGEGGSWFTGGGNGGKGGKGGNVLVEGNWNITTGGDKAHGIWAKSVGGNAGSGGSAGWLGTASAGAGGRATDGGKVEVISGGTIITVGDDSYGIYAESIGGFGGTGGGGFGLFHSAGGNGDSAGSGGDVTVWNHASGSISTEGERSHAIYAQSVGGGGGSGGGTSGFVADAGSGAPGGNGGIVTVTNDGVVGTSGGNSHGIYAQSVGGGGGDGGAAVGAGAVGGRGSSTSDGGEVTVTNNGTITTEGEFSKAIFAQSIGGGGGDGGSSSGLVSIGGAGGGGGDADTVTVTNTGQLVTSGADSSGVFAQSVGGGGGNGGSSVAVGAFISVAIGGNGGKGGDAGDTVNVDNQGSIATSGDRSHGIHAQSVGGGGGNGGYAVSVAVGKGASLSVALGGKGGSAGAGRAVNVTSGDTIVTQGKDAHGIFAQSAGGGGGSGGFAVAASVSTGFSASVALGGSGGAGNNGDAVNVVSTGDITTGIADRGSIAIEELAGIDAGIIQLLRGNGYDTIAELSVASLADLEAIDGIDGVIDATVNVLAGLDTATIARLIANSISTIGDLQGKSVDDLTKIGIAEPVANTILEQVELYVQTIPTTLLDQAKLQMQKGDHAYGILAQSVGGGGGDGGFSVAGSLGFSGAAAFSMGGPGGPGAGGGAVHVYSEGNITTYGKDSHAIVAQSVGGGGGSGGFSVAGAISGGSGAAASLGGKGGSGSTGGAVAVKGDVAKGQQLYITGEISTAGDHAYGILAQSVGGGGGDGGFSVAGTLSKGGLSAAFSMGGGGGGGGPGGTVDVFSGNTITTRGKDSHGIVAQSVGGGGGTGGFSVAGGLTGGSGVAASLGGSGGGGGNAGSVMVDSIGSITTGIAGKNEVTIDQLAGIDIANIALLQDEGFQTIAELSVAPEEDLAAIDGIDEATAAEIAQLARLFMQQDSHSYGILAQSVGGGGGDGGFSVAGAISKGASAAFSMGGSGEQGGTGGSAEVHNGGSITTHGASSHGVVAQSVGGGGGTGGFSAAGSISADKGAKSLSVSLGGGGGDGGNAGAATVVNSGGILTSGERANGVYAQSIGGGGGDGGMSFAGTLGGPDAKSLSVSIGGFGGDGGFAGPVDVTNSGTIETTGSFSSGISAQSVGGGGGNGGTSASLALGAAGQKSNYNFAVSLGGFGGKGGAGGSVNVRNCLLAEDKTCSDDPDQGASIATLGNESHGIYAQSVGGGGGDGGSSLALTVGLDPGKDGKSNNLAVAIGGFGGDGNLGGEVTVENKGAIDTSGNEAHGIFAQSVGGGGGNGGSARTISLVLGPKEKKKDDDQQNGDDGQQGGGSDTGDTGSGSDGTGDGDTGNGDSKDSKKKPKSNKSLELAVGGTAGDGGAGGDVHVDNTGSITTRGADSHAIFAQSIGGGGGTGGNGAHGVPENLPIPSKAEAALKKGQKEFNKLKNSKKLDIVVGGNGGQGNHGGDVTVDHTGDIATLNDGAYGVLAQSVGAGGGIGGNGAIGQKGKFGIGGGGGASGDGGDVTVDIDGSIETYGLSAHGIFAQSVGGGGGIAGDLDFGIIDAKEDDVFGTGLSTPKLNIGIGIAYQRDGGSAGNGGDVTITSTGDITTFGHASFGIFAQSVGGGGGLAGDVGFGLANEIVNVAACIIECNALVGSTGGDGAGGDIEITHTGDITTSGDAAHGIFAQSAGGQADDVKQTTPLLDGNGNPVRDPVLDDEGNVIREGNVVLTDLLGPGGTPVLLPDLADLGGGITIVIDGNITVEGAEAHGIFAQSIGGDGNGDISITVLGGTVQGGSGSGAGVRLKGGSTNTLENHGTITSVDGALGDAIFAGDGNESVDNFGVVTGSVNLGAGSNAFNNHVDATLNAGSIVALGSTGSAGTLSNDGTLSPGGDGAVLTTDLTGDLVQSDAGTYAVDLDPETGASDRLDVSGTADLGGEVFVGIVNGGFAKPGTHESTILTGAGGATDSGLGLDFAPSAVADYALLFSSPTEVTLTTTIDYSPTGLNGNNSAIGRHINDIQTAGGSASFAPVAAALLELPDLAALGEAMETLSPEPYLDSQAVTVYSNQRFTEAMLSCREREGDYRFTSEGECGWMDVSLRRLDGDRTANNAGFEERAVELSGGAQFAVGDDLYAGFGLSWEGSNLDVEDLATVDGDRLQAGAVVKKLYGGTKVTGAISGGVGFYDSKRFLSVPAPGTTASGDQRIGFVSGDIRASTDIEQASWYVRPIVGAQVTYLRFGAFNETGAGGANLNIAAGSDTYWSGQAALEFGGEMKEDNDLLVRPFARVGVTHFFSDTSPNITAGLQGAPVGVQPFTITGEIDETVGDVVVGFDFLSKEGINMRVSYSGRFGERTEQGIIGLRGSIRF